MNLRPLRGDRIRNTMRRYKIEHRKFGDELHLDLNGLTKEELRNLNLLLERQASNIESLKLDESLNTSAYTISHKIKLYQSIEQLPPNKLKKLDLTIRLLDPYNELQSNKELALLTDCLSSQSGYLRSFSLKLIAQKNPLYPARYRSLLDVCKAISSMSQTLKHLTLDFSQANLDNTAQSICEAIKRLFRLESLHLTLSINCFPFEYIDICID